MKILLTGASGFLGHAYAQAALRRGHSVTALYHANQPTLGGLERTIRLDAQQPEDLTGICLEFWPDAIINCAALSNPADVDAEPKKAEKVNVALPRLLAQLATHLGSRLIHVSSDMVFDGRSDSPYRSTDMPAPTTLYGQTKLMAEREVLEHNPEDPVVLRLPILMGNSPSRKRSVHEKLLQSIQTGQKPKLYRDEIRQPCSASNAAEVMLELTERRDLHGIFHWAGEETLSRFEMGQRILKHFGLPCDAVASTSREDDARPANLTLNLHPIVSKLKTKPVDFQEQLEELTRIEPLNARC